MIWRCREATRTGWLLYRAEEPLTVHLTTTVPRVLLQGLFLTLLGRALGGTSGAQYAFVGSVAFAACTRTVVSIVEVPALDQWCDTYYRLQRGRLHPCAVYACRGLPYLLSGLASSAIVLLIDGPLLGLADVSLHLVRWFALIAVTTVTSFALGLAVSAFAAGRRSAEVLFGNLAAYLILATAGIVTPFSKLPPWLADPGELLPLRHGVEALRAAMLGQPWGGQMLRECAVGGMWFALAALILLRQNAKARSQTGVDLSWFLRARL